MYLIDDIDGVFAYLRRDAHLVNQRTDILHGVVRRRVQFVDIERPLLVERLARFALVARVVAVERIETVDGLRENTGAGGLPHSTRTAEEVRMRQMVLTNRVLQRLRERLLAYHRFEGLRPVLTR